MNTFLKDLAEAHKIHEGYAIGTVSYRNNNPGNLRAKDGHFIHYSSYWLGLLALEGDISAKIQNKSKSMDRYYVANHITYAQATMQDYINVYAPSGDNNNPKGYCDYLCEKLKAYNIQPTTSLYNLSALIRGDMDRIPDPVQVIDPEARIRGLERRLTNETNPALFQLINFTLKRLIARTGRVS